MAPDTPFELAEDSYKQDRRLASGWQASSESVSFEVILSCLALGVCPSFDDEDVHWFCVGSLGTLCVLSARITVGSVPSDPN